jgi:hypothetical protein
MRGAMSEGKICLLFSIMCPAQATPGAFDYALPLKKWKKSLPECYHEMLVRVMGEVGRSEEGKSRGRRVQSK